MKRAAFTTALGIAAALAAAPLAHAQDIAVTVEADKPGPQISRQIFGQFAEHLGTGIYGGVWVGEDSPIPNVRGIRTDVVDALKAIRVPNVRYPGGCFADEYHWRDGIGERSKRPATINANWGGAIESNQFGTDEFYDFIEQIGAEAFISVNVGSGTVKDAADWMAYMTADTRSTAGQERAANGHAEQYEVKILGLGNESWGCGGNMRPDHYVDLLKRFARFSRNYNSAQTGEKTMQRVAVGPGDPNTAYTEAVMKAWSERDWTWSIEGLSLHHYAVPSWPPSLPSTNFGEADYVTVTKVALRIDDMIRANKAIMDKYDPEKKVALMVDEWGVWVAEDPGTPKGFLSQQNSLRDAIIAGLNFNIFARHADRVRGANIAQMVNVLQAMILTDGPKMMLTPTYHIHKMYLPMQDATLIPVTYDAGEYRYKDEVLPGIDAVAFRDTAGAHWLAVVNLDPAKAKTARFNLGNLRARRAVGSVLTAPEVASINTYAAPDAVKPVPVRASVSGGVLSLPLPGKSVTVVKLED